MNTNEVCPPPFFFDILTHYGCYPNIYLYYRFVTERLPFKFYINFACAHNFMTLRHDNAF